MSNSGQARTYIFRLGNTTQAGETPAPPAIWTAESGSRHKEYAVPMTRFLRAVVLEHRRIAHCPDVVVVGTDIGRGFPNHAAIIEKYILPNSAMINGIDRRFTADGFIYNGVGVCHDRHRRNLKPVVMIRPELVSVTVAG